MWTLYWSEAKRAWLGTWKEADTGAWRNKAVPCEITHEEEAEAWFTQWWQGQRIDAAAPAPVVRLTVAQLAAWWVGYLKTKPGADPRAASDAERLLRLWIEPFAFGRVFVDSLAIEHCVDWIEDVQRSGRAPLTVRNIVQAVRAMFSDARGKGRYRGENLFNDAYVKKRLKGAQPRAGRDVIVHLTSDQVLAMCSYDGDGVPIRRHARNILAALSGLRAGELQALRWCDLELDAQVPLVRVHRQFVPRLSTVSAPAFKPPKRNSKRAVPLHPEAVRVLRTWLSLTPFARPEDPVFCDGSGGYIQDFRPPELRLDLGAYGVPPLFEGVHPITPHSLRKTCLTLLTNAGVSEGDVKLVAGHASANVTRKHYVAVDLERLYKGVCLILGTKTLGSSATAA